MSAQPIVAPRSGGGEGSPSPDNGTLVSTVRLADPAGSSAGLLEHLRWYVEGLRPEMFRDPDTGQMRGVRGIAIEAEELAPLGGRQLALLPGEDGRAANPERLLAAERVLARLQARWGEAAVQQADLVASRRPERAFRWRETRIQTSSNAKTTASRAEKTSRPSYGKQRGRSKQRPYRTGGGGAGGGGPTGGMRSEPPRWLLGVPEEVEVDRGGRLPNGRWRPGGIRQEGRRFRRIVRAAGPWRLVEHWSAEPIARDAYHVVLADGAACWLVHDRNDDRWRLFGTFD